MRFEFYTIAAGELGRPELRLLESAGLDDVSDDAVEAVNAAFMQLVQNNPDIDPIVVISSTIGDSPGRIVATEYVHALPKETTEHYGKQHRSLAWVTHASTGLVAKLPQGV